MCAASSEASGPAWRVILPALLCLLLPLAAPAAEPELRVLPLKHRLADEVIPVIRPLLLPGESVSGLDSRLIVRASPRSLAQIEQLLGEIDIARRNLRITVSHGGEQETVHQDTGVSGDVRSGNTRIMISGAANDNGGLTVRRSGAHGSIETHTERRISTARDTHSQSLRVLDGGRAFLRVGQSMPEVQPFLALAGNRLVVAAGIQYRDVTTGFEVEPHLQGEQVRLAVTPRLAFLSSHGLQTVNFQELGTVVTVRLGEWVDLGGMVESANQVNRQILSTRHNRGSGDSRFLVRVDLP